MVTYLHEFVPSSRHNDRVLWVGAEPHTADPLRMTFISDGKLAVSQGVPQLDRAVAGPGHNLTVVGGEGDGENVIGVADKAAGGSACRELPQTKCLVPGSRKSVGAVRGDDAVRDDVRVAVK